MSEYTHNNSQDQVLYYLLFDYLNNFLTKVISIKDARIKTGLSINDLSKALNLDLEIIRLLDDNLKLPKKPLKDQKSKYSVSDFQKSERDFAFIVDRKVKAQDLISVISSIDKNLISNIKVFDVYEGENIPENQKSIAISVTIQSSEKTLTDNDLEKINNLIIETVENKTGAKIRS